MQLITVILLSRNRNDTLAKPVMPFNVPPNMLVVLKFKLLWVWYVWYPEFRPEETKQVLTLIFGFAWVMKKKEEKNQTKKTPKNKQEIRFEHNN